MIRSERATFWMRVAFSAAAAVLILAGGSLNAEGRSGGDLITAAIAGFMAIVAGAAYSEWTIAGPMAGGSLLVVLLSVHFNFGARSLPIQLAGVVLLAMGGIVGGIAYRSFTDALRSRLEQVEDLNAQLEDKQRAFMAATQDAEGSSTPADAASLTAQLAHHLGAAFAVCYLVSPDGTQFLPQAPGIGLDRLHPQPVPRRRESAGPMISAIEAGKDFAGADKSALLELVNYVPDDMTVEGVLAVSLPIGNQVSGFVLLGNKPGGFTDDDRRLAMTLSRRAGAQLVTAHAVAMSQEESARHTVMSGLVREASGKTTEEVLALVLDRAQQVIKFDSGRILLFQPDDTYMVLGGGSTIAPVATELARVRLNETVVRNRVFADDGVYSGVKPSTAARTVHEALVPIRSASGVIGALCLGRAGSPPFSQRDAASLTELGSMAGVAVENSLILQVATGQATKREIALDAIAEIAQALTSVTEGAEVNERKMLEAAARITGSSAGLLTRGTDAGTQRVIMSLGFPDDVNLMEFTNGQGIVGAVMLSHQVTAIADVTKSFDLGSPPDLKAFGLMSAMCTPMIEGRKLWGTLSVFDLKRREWTQDDQRVLATLGSQGLVAIGNAELYDRDRRSIWHLTNLQEAMQEVTKTLDPNKVQKQVLDGAGKAAQAQIGCLALEDSGRLVLRNAFGTDAKTAEKLALQVGGDICKQVMASGRPFMEAMQPKGADSPLNPRAVLCVAITLRDKPLGVVFLANYQAGHTFTADHLDLVTELAGQAAVVIDNARLFQDREVLTLESLGALANAVDERDPWTAGHSQRVTEYAKMIARQMKYSPNDNAAWTRLERGVSFHDIGKVAVPDAILQKPGKLTDEEFAKMKAHTTIGYDILSGLRMLTDELIIVRSHHERFDGKGYPDRKKGDELPIFAWIASAADAIDAMTSDRPYRKGMTLEVAIDQVRQGAGTHFHPDVSEAVLDAAHNGTLKLIAQESIYSNAPAVGAFENPVAQDATRRLPGVSRP